MNTTREHDMKTRYIVTRHGYDRMKERMGLGKKATERMIVKVYNEGLSCQELEDANLKEYMHRKGSDPASTKSFKIYGQSLYCFATKHQVNGIDEVCLITTFPLPRKLRNAATDQQKRLRMAV